MDAVVTKDIAIRAVLAGACAVPKVGAKASTLSTEHLIWAEKLFTAEELAALPIPLWAMSGYGDGYGNGDGYGDGNGYGNGYGNGDGYGDGYGNGDGYGYGYGNGNGDGYGNGNGDGNGDGNGSDPATKILAIQKAA